MNSNDDLPFRPILAWLSWLALHAPLTSQADVGSPPDPQGDGQVLALLAYLQAATEQANYTCTFSIDEVALSRPVRITPQDSWAFLLPHLKRPATSTPLVAGKATFQEGRFAVTLHNDLYGENSDVSALYDGEQMVTFYNEEHATVRGHATSLFLPALPWTLFTSGGTQGAASLRTASMRNEAETSPAQIGDSRGFDVTFPLPMPANRKEGIPTICHIEARWHASHSRVLPCLSEIRGVEGQVFRRMSVLEFELIAGTPMPTNFQVEVCMNTVDNDPPRVVYKGRVDYASPGPLPQSVVDRLGTIGEIRTAKGTFYPKRGIDTAIDRVVERSRTSPARAGTDAATEATATTGKTITWPSIAMHLAQASSVSLTRHQVTSEFHLHAALALVARLQGSSLQVGSLVEKYPQGLLSIADVVRLLEENGLPSVATELTRQQIAKCKRPVIVMDKRSGSMRHTAVVFGGIDQRFAWSLDKSLTKVDETVEGAIGGDVLPVIISREDMAAVR